MRHVIPCFRFTDAPAMVAWLCRVFGFEPTMVVEDGEGGIAHAQLAGGAGMLMVGSRRDDAFGRHLSSSAALGATTTCLYLVVDDADAIHARALEAGAELVMPLADKDYGGREFTCRDPEGGLWSVGTYDPFAAAGGA